MDGWEVALWTAAGYLAVSPLVRMMLARRERFLVEFRARLAKEKRRRKREDRDKAETRSDRAA